VSKNYRNKLKQRKNTYPQPFAVLHNVVKYIVFVSVCLVLKHFMFQWNLALPWNIAVGPQQMAQGRK